MVSGPGRNPGSEFLREGNPGSNPGSDPDFGREVLLGQAPENVWSASGKCRPFILVFWGTAHVLEGGWPKSGMGVSPIVP
jgi:hypothetical protein